MSTEKSVAHPAAASMPSQVPPLFAFRPRECLEALEPAVATVEDISRWMAELANLEESEVILDASARAQMRAIAQRVIDAADAVAWDLDVVIEAIKAAQMGGCA